MQNFDFNEALKGIQAGKPITGSDGVLAPLIKQLTEAALNAEIQSHDPCCQIRRTKLGRF